MALAGKTQSLNSVPGARTSLPLWQLLQSVATVVAAVRSGSSASPALEKVGAEQRPAVQALAFHVLRNLGAAEALRTKLASRAPPAQADALLCTALALACQADTAPYEVFTLVNQTVEAAKRSSGMHAQANFINACLRRFLREQEALVADLANDLVARWNHPVWWIKRLKADYPTAWQAILANNNTQAPMTLRVNVKKSDRNAYLALLGVADISAIASGQVGVTLQKARQVQDIPGFAQGVVSVQDASAQLAAPLLLGASSHAAQPMRVLDACAAPGGKTAHLLETGHCEVVAIDIDPLRCQRIQQNLSRLGLAAQLLTADAALPQTWWDGVLFDAVLLDAPCTASGIVRRHPDVRWLRRESDIAQLAQVQARLLKALWPLVKPGGRLLYCTCSVFRAEGADQMQTFLAHNTDARLMASPGQLLPHFCRNGDTVPDNPQDDHDGFYLALLEKSKV